MSIERAITIAKELKSLIASSPTLDSSSLTAKEFPYQTPFGADTMEPCKWLYCIYLDRAIEALENKDLTLFKEIKDFSFYFTHYYEHSTDTDAKKMCKLVVEFEHILLKIQDIR